MGHLWEEGGEGIWEKCAWDLFSSEITENAQQYLKGDGDSGGFWFLSVKKDVARAILVLPSPFESSIF